METSETGRQQFFFCCWPDRYIKGLQFSCVFLSRLRESTEWKDSRVIAARLVCCLFLFGASVWLQSERWGEVKKKNERYGRSKNHGPSLVDENWNSSENQSAYCGIKFSCGRGYRVFSDDLAASIFISIHQRRVGRLTRSSGFRISIIKDTDAQYWKKRTVSLHEYFIRLLFLLHLWFQSPNESSLCIKNEKKLFLV